MACSLQPAEGVLRSAFASTALCVSVCWQGGHIEAKTAVGRIEKRGDLA